MTAIRTFAAGDVVVLGALFFTYYDSSLSRT